MALGLPVINGSHGALGDHHQKSFSFVMGGGIRRRTERLRDRLRARRLERRGGLWPRSGAVPSRAAPASVAAVPRRILLEAEDVIVVEKPPDVSMDGKATVTMDKVAELWFPGKPVRWAHRLDHGTSGVLVGALTRDRARSLGRAFEQRLVRKRYLAAVCGHVGPSRFRVDAALGRAREGDFEVAAGARARVDRKPALTLARVLRRGLYGGQPVSLVRLTPRTGRRHQLRVHLAHVGHPIVGDATYDASECARAPRMCLHAAALRAPLDDKRELRARSPAPFYIRPDGALAFGERREGARRAWIAPRSGAP